ncbi:MAG: regulatory protein RecX [Clostridia bacterium]|nr:regulatory protein RecX [Clostridia bacterium]
MDIDRAKKAVAKLVSYKMYTCREICRRLLKKGFDENIAEEAVSEFVKAGILNDEEYARLYIHDAALIGLKGMFRIKQELLAKGIAASVVERAIAEVEVDTEKQLEEYVKLKFANKELSDWKEIEKAKAHLARRGYGISEINKCFKRLNIGQR